MSVHSVLSAVTARIMQKSAPTRTVYLKRLQRAVLKGPQRGALSCTNLAHGFAAFAPNEIGRAHV